MSTIVRLFPIAHIVPQTPNAFQKRTNTLFRYVQKWLIYKMKGMSVMDTPLNKKDPPNDFG